MKKKKFLIIKIALIVAISIILGFILYTWNSQMMMGSSLPMPFGFGIAEVLSDSMYPNIQTHDVVIIVPQDDYEIDDIVAFQDRDMVVLHRIIGQNEDGTFITKGDYAENSQDPTPLKSTHIYGKHVKTFKGAGKFFNVIKSPIVSFSLLLIAGLFFFLSSKKEKADDNEDIERVKREIAKLKGEETLTVDDIQAQIDALKKEQQEREKKKNNQEK